MMTGRCMLRSLGPLALSGLALGGVLARGPLARAQAAEPSDDNATTDDTPDEPLETVPPPPMKSGPHTYTVRPGESLSLLSQRFTGDPMGWPKLWALNPDIPNPNRIRPGQVIRVSGPPAKEEKITPVPEAAAESPRRPGPRPLVAVRGMSRPLTRPAAPRLRQLSFVDEGTLRATGTINGSPEEKIMLATGDQAYVQFPEGQAPKPPARYSVYQVDTTHPVREPGSNVTVAPATRPGLSA